MYLVEAAEAYLHRHPQDGFDLERASPGAPAPARNGGEGDSGSSTSSSDGQLATKPGRFDGVVTGGARAKGRAAIVLGPALAVTTLHPTSTECPQTPPFCCTVEKADAQEKGVAGGASSALASEHRWGAPYLTQVALLFRRSLRTRRFEVGGRQLDWLCPPREKREGPGLRLVLHAACAGTKMACNQPRWCHALAPPQTMKGQDIAQFLAIAVLAGLFWLQAGQDDTVLG